MMDAGSLFSLAPLRYFGSPPFRPAKCLEGITAGKALMARDKHLDTYHHRTWLRRYLVTLVLVGTFFLTSVAVALLVAGRQLQHRCLPFCVFCFYVLCSIFVGGRTCLLSHKTSGTCCA